MFYLDRGGLPWIAAECVVACKNAYKRHGRSSRLRQMTIFAAMLHKSQFVQWFLTLFAKNLVSPTPNESKSHI